MQVQEIKTNNYNTNFGSKLIIDNNSSSYNIDKYLRNFLKREFRKNTSAKNGSLKLYLDNWFEPSLTYNNDTFMDVVSLKEINLSEPKEKILERLVNAHNIFVIRENAQKQINLLKEIIKGIAHNADNDCKQALEKTDTFHIEEFSLCNDVGLIENARRDGNAINIEF